MNDKPAEDEDAASSSGTGEASAAVAPHGPAAVKLALMNAALELYAERSPAAVSVRDVARKAGVNHGLVHRYFGSKQGLVHAAMESLTQRMAQDMSLPENRGALAAFQATARAGYWRVLARALLDGISPSTLQGDFPVMAKVLKAVQAAQAAGTLDPRLDPRVITAMAGAMGLGWLLFEPFLLTATGLEEVGAKRARADMMELVVRMIARVRP